jgi:predicted PurR-regulated permease PerM
MGAGWGIGPVGLLLAVLVIAFLLNGYRGRRSRL